MLFLSMAFKNEITGKIREFSALTPDPARAERNLFAFFNSIPEEEGKDFLPYIEEIALLFSASQFLANHLAANPHDLMYALEEIKEPLSREKFSFLAQYELVPGPEMEPDELMRQLRKFKKRHLTRVTLRDLTGETDIKGSMDELTFLAEAVISVALDWSLQIARRRFGAPEPENGMALIAVGKLGGEELNYSSDIDLMAVYSESQGETSGQFTRGIPTPSGVFINKISNHEFYLKVMELFTKLLSANTDEGICYRVDLRLRPQGQKGDIALPLSAYKSYYESWGRTWERMMLLRARPVAGDNALGIAFMQVIEPFVWRRTMDYQEVEEIRALKKKIDSIFSRDDIKRGYGGLREAEFFIQTFQLFYGPEELSLRTNRISRAVQGLRKLFSIPEKDLSDLMENYLFLRRVEHYLQMKDDLQTHTLPQSEEEFLALSKKMGFPDSQAFLSDLRLRRIKTKNMYNSLLGTEEDINAEALGILEGDLSDSELKGYLSFRGVSRTEKGLADLKGIREKLGSFITSSKRAQIRKVIPGLLEKALKAESPDRALAGLESFFNVMGVEEAHLTALLEEKPLAEGIVKIFSLSPYLARVFLSDRIYLGLYIEGSGVIRKSMRRMEEELEKFSLDADKETIFGLMEDYKKAEEIRLGMYFLNDVLRTPDLLRYLSHLADAIIRRTAVLLSIPSAFSVIALGKLGGREITYGSDLDLIFVSENPSGIKAAEQLTKALASYTGGGRLYEVDMRLRPDGSKGALIKDLKGYRDYYLKQAKNWEIQALLKARPVAGDPALGRAFMEMRKDVISRRGPEIKLKDVAAMRERIFKELSPEARDAEAIDIKLGRGGMGEIEFYIQWLALQNARDPMLLVQNTFCSINRLAAKNIFGPGPRHALKDAYSYLRRLQTFQRLNDDLPLKKGTEFSRIASLFMGHKGEEEFFSHLSKLKRDVLAIIRALHG